MTVLPVLNYCLLNDFFLQARYQVFFKDKYHDNFLKKH